MRQPGCWQLIEYDGYFMGGTNGIDSENSQHNRNTIGGWTTICNMPYPVMLRARGFIIRCRTETPTWPHLRPSAWRPDRKECQSLAIERTLWTLQPLNALAQDTSGRTL